MTTDRFESGRGPAGPAPVAQWLAVIASLSVSIGAFAWDAVSRWRSADWNLLDDAHMFLRYARMIQDGHGVAWNAGEGAVYGITSQAHLLWVLCLDAWTGLDGAYVLAVSSLVPTALALVAIPAICARASAAFAMEAPLSRYAVWAALLWPFLIFCTPIPYHAFTGMDTALSLASHCGLALACLRFAPAPRFSSGVVLALAAWFAWAVRPENAVASLGLPLLLGWSAGALRRFAPVVLAIAGLLALDLMLRVAVFGDALPLSFHAKRSGFLEGFAGVRLWHPLRRLPQFVAAAAPFAVLHGFEAVVGDRRRALAWAVPAVVGIASFFRAVTIMDHEARYYVPFLVYLIVGAAFGLGTLMSLPRGKATRMGGALLAIAALLFAGASAARGRIDDALELLVAEPELCRARTEFGVAARIERESSAAAIERLAKLLQSMPPGFRIAMSETGLVGAMNPQVAIVDLAGLHDRDIAHRGFDVDALLDREPDAIWLAHVHYTCVNAAIVDSPRFWAEYDYYPELFAFGLAVRRGDGMGGDLLRAIEADRRSRPGPELRSLRANHRE